jgi:hypothetical protein
LGGIQDVKRCNLTVHNFKTLGKLRNNYSYHLHTRAWEAGKSTRQKHAHMHTQMEVGIDTELAVDIEKNFTWTPPLS